MCQNRKPSLAEAATTDAQRENIQAIVGLLEESSQAEEATSALKALHLLAGAMDGEQALLAAFIVPYSSVFSKNGSLAHQ